jgi:succinate-semialdehyde dehydrogenase/glutarate-semialdehyde dehydrogenase
MPIQTQNPYTEKVEKVYKPDSDATIERKIKLAHDAHLKWETLSISKRAVYLRKVAKLLLKNKKQYGAVITKEMGKPITQSISEVEKCALNCNFYADNAEKFLKEEIHDTEMKHASVAFEPLGVILAVMPWNFPFWQVFRCAAPALMAGNAMVLKHASNVPACTLLIQEIFEEAGLPKNLFVSLLAESNQVEKIIRNPFLRAVTLTGSESAGAKVASIAGSEIKKVVLELGGSDPFVILKNVDLKKAVAAAVQSRMPNAGQVCVSGKRFIIEKGIVKEAIELIKKEAEKIIVGNPIDPETNMGPLSKKDIRDEVADQVDRSIKNGAKLIYGGKKIDRKGYFYEPTVITNVKKGMPAYDEEIFGPVMSIIVAENDADAIRIANDHEYGLGAAVWCKDIKRAFKVARAIEAGIVAVNGVARSDPRFPFGGTKKSGIGRELGSQGIREFVNIKTILAK